MDTSRTASVSPALIIAVAALVVAAVAGLAWWYFGRSTPKESYLPSSAAISTGRAAPPRVPTAALPPPLAQPPGGR